MVILCWSGIVVWLRTMTEKVGPQDFVSAEAIGLAVAGTLWCLLVPGHTMKVAPKNYPGILAVALTTSFAALYLWFEGFRRTSTVTATFLGHTQIVFIALLGAWRLGERMKKGEMAGAGLMILSALLVSSRYLEDLWAMRFGNTGDLMVMGATVLWAYGAVVSKQLMDRMKGAEILAWRGLISSVAAVAVAHFMFGTWVYDHPFLLLYSGLVGVGFLGYYLALERLQANEVATWEIATPFATMVLAYVFIGEEPTALQLLGGGVLGAGMWLFTRP